MNSFAFDIEDEELLTSSYQQLQNKESIRLVENPEEQAGLLRDLHLILNINHTGIVSFQNLFEVSTRWGVFYLAQCLLDYGYPVSIKGGQILQRQYSFQAFGFSRIVRDLRHTIMRPELPADDFVFKLFDRDIDIDGAEQFNDKYYLVSNQKEEVIETLNSEFLEAISSCEGLMMRIENQQMFLAFASELRTDHLAALQKVLCSCHFLGS